MPVESITSVSMLRKPETDLVQRLGTEAESPAFGHGHFPELSVSASKMIEPVDVRFNARSHCTATSSCTISCTISRPLCEIGVRLQAPQVFNRS